MNRRVRNLGVSLVAAALLTGSMTFGVNAAPVDPLACGKACLSKGQFAQAVKDLEEVVKKTPNSCEGHLLLGKALCKMKNYARAKQHLRTAIKVGKGSVNAQQANQLLMSLPRTLVAPKTGADTRMISAILGIGGRDRGAGEPKPTVIDFYASWCKPCKDLTPLLEKAKAQYGDKVKFMKVDVDDPNNEQIVEQYEVSPIPTVVFLNPEGEVITYSIGFAGEQAVSDGIKKILPTQHTM